MTPNDALLLHKSIFSHFCHMLRRHVRHVGAALLQNLNRTKL